MVRSYDKQCLALAVSFLSDTEAKTEAPYRQAQIAHSLALEIQQTIEDFLQEQGLHL